MSRRRDNSGVPNTCPLIDEIISFITNCKYDDETEWHSKKDLIDIMEEIRTRNSDLREYGIEQSNRVDELEDEVLKLERQISDLKEDISDLKAELSQRIDEISELENEIIEIKNYYEG